MKRFAFLAALALLGSSAARAQDAETVPVDRVVAVVGNVVILWSDLLE